MKTKLIALSFLMSAAAMPAAADEPNVENGRNVYQATGCWQCHGYGGQGGSVGPRVGPSPLPLGVFTDYLREPTGTMPRYSERVLSDEDIADLHAFLASLPPADAGPARGSTPPMRPSRTR